MLYVAVVVKKSGAASGRPKGDWSCFTGNVKAEVIERALDAKRDWQRNGYGPYDVLVGRVAEAVRVPQNWELVDIPRVYGYGELVKAPKTVLQEKREQEMRERSGGWE